MSASVLSAKPIRRPAPGDRSVKGGKLQTGTTRKFLLPKVAIGPLRIFTTSGKSGASGSAPPHDAGAVIEFPPGTTSDEVADRMIQVVQDKARELGQL